MSRIKELIEHIRAHNPAPTSFYIYRDGNGKYHSMVYHYIDINKFFREVSRKYAFADCSDEEVITIFWKGKEVEYAGWQVNMVYEYKDLDGNTMWVGQFSEWDH